MVKLCSYYTMCVSTICPVNWLRLATSFQLRGSGGVKLGFEGAQSFSICKRNNSDNNFGQYQWKLRSLSCSASTVHAIRAAEIPTLLSSAVRYQIRKYSVVRKGQIQDALEAPFNLEESLEKPSKLRRSRTKFGVTVTKDSLEASFHLEEPLENPSKLRRTKSKDLLQDSSLLEEHLGKATKPKKSKRKLDAINSNEISLETSSLLEEPLAKPHVSQKTGTKVGLPDLNKESSKPFFSLGEPLKEPSTLIRTRSKVGGTVTNKEPIQKATKSKKTRRKLDVTDSNEDSLDSASPSVECLTKTSKPRRMRSKVGLTDPKKDMLQVSSLLEEPVGKGSKPKETRRKIEFTDSIEGPLEKPSNSRRRRSKLHSTDPDEDSFMNSSKELVGKVTKSKKSRGKLDVINSNKVFYRMEFDGASKGNPGKAGAGAVLRNQDGSVICELKEGVGRATNNVAEYRAIILGLKVALSRGVQRIHVQGDSKLVCMQIQDKWKISSQNIAELNKEAKELKSKFKEFRIHHIYRELNGEADALANAAIELKNGEIKNGMATYQLNNPLEKASSSQRERSKVDLVDTKKKLSEASLVLEKPLEKPLKSGRTSSSDDLVDTNKGFYRLEFDGASKGNPGKAGAGAVLRNQCGSVICELKENVGIATNNVAEYRAIILGLKAALSKGIERIHVQGDSKLVCMQVQDLWKIKSQNIVVLHMEAKKLISKFKEFRINHVYRELNGEANDLANAAIELQSGD